MNYEEKASISRRAQKLVYTLCSKYKGIRPEKTCRGCQLSRAVHNHDYAAMKQALKAAKA